MKIRVKYACYHVLALNPLQPCDIAAPCSPVLPPRPWCWRWPPVTLDDEAINFLSLHCDGDARVALISLDFAATIGANRGHDERIKITLMDAVESMQNKHLAYDRAGEEHSI